MTLDEEFEKNVEVVVDGLENLIEIIEQQFIYEDLGTKKIKGITLKTSLGKGLKEKALHNVSVTMFMTSSLWRNAFNEILMWLNRYMPIFQHREPVKCNSLRSARFAVLRATRFEKQNRKTGKRFTLLRKNSQSRINPSRKRARHCYPFKMQCDMESA